MLSWGGGGGGGVMTFFVDCKYTDKRDGRFCHRSFF